MCFFFIELYSANMLSSVIFRNICINELLDGLKAVLLFWIQSTVIDTILKLACVALKCNKLKGISLPKISYIFCKILLFSREINQKSVNVLSF